MRRKPLNLFDPKYRIPGLPHAPKAILERAGGFDPEFFLARYRTILEFGEAANPAEILGLYLATVRANRFSPHAGFNEAAYLKHNPDVLRLVDLGVFHSGLHHWITAGSGEQRRGWEIDHAPAGTEIDAAQPRRIAVGGDIVIGGVRLSPRQMPPRGEVRAVAPMGSSAETHSAEKHRRYDEIRAAFAKVHITPAADDRSKRSAADAIGPFFDRTHYLLRYPDLDPAIDPLHHYLHIGWREGRDPSAWFSTAFYLGEVPGLVEAGVNPLWHYATIGRAEGRRGRAPQGPDPELPERHTPLQTQAEEPAVRGPRIDDADLSAALQLALSKRPGLVVSISHDCYPVAIGGTEALIAAEQQRMNGDGFTYLHVSPSARMLRLRGSDDPVCPLRVVLDGQVIGMAEAASVAGAIEASRETASRRVFAVHSVLGHKVEEIEVLHAATEPGSAYFWLHDYSSLCPGFNLLRNDVVFCNAPPPSSEACATCIYGEGRPAHLRDLEGLFNAIAFDVVSPSRATAEIWRTSNYFAYRSLAVVEHATIAYDACEHDLRPGAAIGTPEHPIRVAFAGYPLPHKGWPTFELILEAMSGRDDCVFYHFAALDKLALSDRLIPVETAPSRDGASAMRTRLNDHAIDLVVLPALWPETFSYVAYEALAGGCDIVTLTSSGNIADLTRLTGRGLVFDRAADLIAFFASGGASRYVRARAEFPILTGHLIASGTTAVLEARPT